ncbi:MAG: hypothetical protein ACYCYI_00290 [Saccharofermentanales bacterium]
MTQQIRGIILEGQSCSGKTSIFNALKIQHSLEENAERNTIFLAEHYSQTLNYVNGELKRLNQKENLGVLSDRISMLEYLNNYANSMGEHSRKSRGLFFVFERFILNYANSFNDSSSEEYVQLEERLYNLNTKVILCTIKPENIERRLKHRAFYTNEIVTNADITNYIGSQQLLIDIAKKSVLPTIILETDDLNWDGYAKFILEKIS